MRGSVEAESKEEGADELSSPSQRDVGVPLVVLSGFDPRWVRTRLVFSWLDADRASATVIAFGNFSCSLSDPASPARF